MPLLLPDAVEAALIAGGVSLAGLLITNQSKVSGFRQEWINALREDIALFVTQAFEIHAGRPSGEIAKLNETTSRIQLRLNPEEAASKSVFAAMATIKDTVDAKAAFSTLGVNADVLVQATQVVLKNEWRRVKTGEPFYKWTRRGLVTVMLLLAGVFLRQNLGLFSWTH
jgi:hypothetical protein